VSAACRKVDPAGKGYVMDSLDDDNPKGWLSRAAAYKRKVVGSSPTLGTILVVIHVQHVLQVQVLARPPFYRKAKKIIWGLTFSFFRL